MAKRYTDTDKWKKPFIRGLQGAYKLLWVYILDECDHAGIWQVDIEVASIRLGEPSITAEGAIEAFGDKIHVFSNGEKWFIQGFIDFQYNGQLNPANKTHNSVIKLLNKNKLKPDIEIITPISKPLPSPLQGVKDKDKDKDIYMDKDKGGLGEFFEPVDAVEQEEYQEPENIPPTGYFVDEEQKDLAFKFLKGNQLYILIQQQHSVTPDLVEKYFGVFFEQKSGMNELKGKTPMEVIKNFFYWVPKYKLSLKNNQTNGNSPPVSKAVAAIGVHQRYANKLNQQQNPN